MEVTLWLISFESKYYQSEIRPPTILSYNKHFLDVSGSMLETSSRPFYDFNEMKWQYNVTRQFLGVDIYNFQFSLIHHFKRMQHWKLDITGS